VEGVDPSDPVAQAELQTYRDEMNSRRTEFKRLIEEKNALEAAGESIADAVRAERQARDAFRNARSQLKRVEDRHKTLYASPLRVVEFDNPANRELAQRPIRRATGGMVRSGIGAMAREVM